MFRVLFLLFIIIPIIEITVLMQVGSWLGVFPTVAIVILTAWLGAHNVRQQGVENFQSLQTKMTRGEAPSQEIVAGLLLLVAGILLVTPGFVTDAFGLMLLIPTFRGYLINKVQAQLVRQASQSRGYTFEHSTINPDIDISFGQPPSPKNIPDEKGKILDGEFERKD